MLIFLIVLFSAISDFDAVLGSESEFLLAEIYRQATGSKSGPIGLTILANLPTMGSMMGSMLTASRVFWSLARDNAMRFSRTFSHMSTKWKNPFAEVLFMGCFCKSTTSYINFVSR
jgi:amino acid transporter